MESPATHAATQPFACVSCHSTLTMGDGGARCPTCSVSYPMVAGGIPILVPADRLPDFVPDPGVSFERAVAIAEDLHRIPGTYHDLIDAYYESLRDVIVPDLFDYYRSTVKGRTVNAASDEVGGATLALNVLGRPFPKLSLAVEVGCGWGFSMAGLGKRLAANPSMGTPRLVGLDLNPAILVIARRMFRDLGLPPISVAVADAALPMPLPPRGVDFLFASSVVEHLPRQQECMANIDSALSRDSVFYFAVPNRFMLHPEPHFNVRFVGLLPRRWQRRFVAARMRLGLARVERIMSYSPQDLADLLCPSFPGDMLAVVPAYVPDNRLAWQIITRPIKSLGVWYHHGVVRRTPDAAAPGLLQLGSIHSGRQPVFRRTLRARRTDGPVWPA